jgi:uncharacterized protein YkwD
MTRAAPTPSGTTAAIVCSPTASNPGRTVTRAIRRRAATSTLPIVVALIALLAGASPAAAWDANAVVPASERQIVTWVNQARAAKHLPALRVEGKLTRMARWRSQDMAIRNYFSHQIPPSSVRVMDVMRDRGYCARYVGEAIGWNNESPAVASERIFRMWMDSPAHRAILLGKPYIRIGVGAWRTADARTIWTLIVVRPCS